MSRPMALGLVLLLLILTLYSEWRQQPKSEVELTTAVSKQQQVATKRELVKEQIISAQEKRIYILNELVKNLRQQLVRCQENVAENMMEVVANSQLEVGKLEEDV